MDDAKNGTIISKRMNQRDTRGSNPFHLLRKNVTKMNCTEILSSPSDTLKHKVNMWIRSGT